jgi:hypothetical protein
MPRIPVACVEFVARFGTVVGSNRMLRHPGPATGFKNADVLLVSLYTADLHWRNREWRPALECALRALTLNGQSFAALTIASTSYVYLGETQSGLPYAKRLMAVRPPNWAAIKVVLFVFGIPYWFRASGRKRCAELWRKCDREREAALAHVLWMRDLLECSAGSGLNNVAA